MSERRFGKDFFTSVRFRVSQRYLRPRSRGKLYLLGTVLALVAPLPFMADAFWGRASMVANGSISESHAVFADNCVNCHTPFERVLDQKCESCHEKAAAPRRQYDFERHYLYHSAAFDRSGATSLETPCASCHREHEGTDASLTDVSDAQCTTCHEYGSFDRDHPEFGFVSERVPDRPNLAFTHISHTKRLLSRENLTADEAEQACLICHEPQPDGISFEPLSYEAQCDDCHLTPGKRTAWLPLQSDTAPGVHTLDAILAEYGPASVWASFWNPAEFEVEEGEVRKQPVYHADPWIIENLTRIRVQLYPGAELAELLRSAPDLVAGTEAGVHEEAVSTLRTGMRALRGNPSADVQSELDALGQLLDSVEARLERPFAARDETRFLVRRGDAEGGAVSLGADSIAFEAVTDSLTSLCQLCHVVSRATIVGVQKDQRTLTRSEFDHSAHVIQRGCLDCHTSIPVARFIAEDDLPIPPEVDRAGILNLPTAASCRDCHSDRGAPNECTSCHVFHPDRSQRSNLSRTHR